MSNNKCECELNLLVCPDQRELFGSSQYPVMSCEAIIRALVLMSKRIECNLDASITGLSAFEREYIKMSAETLGVISTEQMVQL